MEVEVEKRDDHREDGGDDDVAATDFESEEMKRVALLRETVEKKDQRVKVLDDLSLRRFLRARNLDVEKASSMLLRYLEWRSAAVPKGLISESEIEKELEGKKVFMQGFSKKGQPIAVVFPAKHFAAKRDLEELKRLVIYSFDKMCARMPKGKEKFVCIGDLKGWGYYANCDLRAYLAGLDILQSYYPERLGKAFLIHVPYLFMKAWKIVYPFIDENTKKKFIFVEDKDLHRVLLEDIDESQLPEIYGGKLPLIAADECDGNPPPSSSPPPPPLVTTTSSSTKTT